MANPRQRRKARSGTGKTKQSKRQQDRLRKIIVTGPEALRAEWDVKKTAHQNLAKLGLASRPLALRQSGGKEKHVENALVSSLDGDDNEESGSEEDAYATSEDDVEDEDSEEQDEDDANMEHKVVAQPSTNKTSTEIPKGYARIIRDDKGNVIDVVMSAMDEPDEPSSSSPAEASTSKKNTMDNDDDDEQTTIDTPWGKPLSSKKESKRLQKLAEPVPAKSAAIRDLEQRSQEQRKTTSASTRFASSQEIDHLRRLVSKHGKDTASMARDLKLNPDQRTSGQLRKAIERVGGVDALLVQ